MKNKKIILIIISVICIVLAFAFTDQLAWLILFPFALVIITLRKRDKTKKNTKGKVPGRTYRYTISDAKCNDNKAKLSTYGHEPTQNGIAELERKYGNLDVTGKELEIIEFKFDAFTEEKYNKGLKFCIDGKQIGTRFYDDGDELYEAVINKQIDEIYIEIFKDDDCYRTKVFYSLKQAV